MMEPDFPLGLEYPKAVTVTLNSSLSVSSVVVIVMFSTLTPSTSATSDSLSANSNLFVTLIWSGSLISNPPTFSGLKNEVTVLTCIFINSPGSGTSPVAKV